MVLDVDVAGQLPALPHMIRLTFGVRSSHSTPGLPLVVFSLLQVLQYHVSTTPYKAADLTDGQEISTLLT